MLVARDQTEPFAVDIEQEALAFVVAGGDLVANAGLVEDALPVAGGRGAKRYGQLVGQRLVVGRAP